MLILILLSLPENTWLEEIVARGISQKELARRMGRPANAINEIINGKKGNYCRDRAAT